MTSNNRWRKSSYSGGQANNCVELKVAAGHTDVRDTKNRSGGALNVNRTSWSSFVTAIREGKLDH